MVGNRALKTDIFIRSYEKDFLWLNYCLKSIVKNTTGFLDVHIAAPYPDVEKLSHLTLEKVHGVVDSCSGYLAQQITKFHADEYCKSDYILHVDSDCVFTDKVTPQVFFIDGKPIMLQEKDVKSPWYDVSERALGWRDEYEYMRRMPIIYPRWIYSTFRKWFLLNKGVSIDQWVSEQPDFLFSEFNTLGTWAKKFYPDAFTWMTPKDVPIVCKQYWSWGGINDAIDQLEEITK
jgi:hypothetical protein